MYNKLNNLAFVIGAFFTVVSLILFANIFLKGTYDSLSVFTAITFIIFGVVMMLRG
jgi:hypothetical protein